MLLSQVLLENRTYLGRPEYFETCENGGGFGYLAIESHLHLILKAARKNASENAVC